MNRHLGTLPGVLMLVTGCHRILGIPNKGLPGPDNPSNNPSNSTPDDAPNDAPNDAAILIPMDSPADTSMDALTNCTDSMPPSGVHVSGAISDAHWTAAESPYILTGDLSILSLTIDPGVTILAAGNFVFEVAGTLSAVGSRGAPITFTSAPCNMQGWQGLYFNSSQPSDLAFATIEKSQNGGIRVQDASPTIQNCIIHDNTANQGGGIYIDGTMSAPSIANCRIEHNTATNGHEAGGGVFVRDGSPEFRNAIIVNNGSVYANAHGGGFYGCGGQSVLINVIIKDNGTSVFGNGSGGVAVDTLGTSGCPFNASVSIKNSIIFNNVPFQMMGSVATITYSDIQGGFPGDGNISANPLFIDADYRLSSGSTCIDAGDPVTTDDDACSPVSGTIRNDMGAYGGPLGCAW